MTIEELIIIVLIIALIWILVKNIRLQTSIENRARTLHEAWRLRDLTAITQRMEDQSDETIRREVGLQTREWQRKEEERIRQDAIKRSREVIHGKVTEHLIPFFPSFPWNPSDARFLGSPVDFVVFDGLSEGEVREIIFVEVKSGINKRLSSRERSVERCVHRQEFSFRIIHPDDEKPTHTLQHDRHPL
ncbi:MAG TPA: Holliday junction resolvase-like protein [Methanospirillum sp.]|nr:Holliday junction resolvase-like protein [Methanospirillum sp.]